MSIENTTTDASITFLGTGNATVRRCNNTCLVLEAGGRLLVCLSNEPFNEANRPMAQDADRLLSEAFCLHRDRDIFKPYEKHHSTALDAGRTAQRLGVRNLVLYHTEESDLAHRKALYTEEAATEYSGNVFMSDNLERIILSEG